MSIRAFHDALQARRPVPKGASYASVHKYLKGQGEPPLQLVQAAADLLRLREEWLLSGEGAPTEVDASAKHVGGEKGFVTDRVDARMREIFPLYDSLPAYVRSMAWHTIVVLSSVIPQPVEEETGEAGRNALLMRAGEIVASCMAYPSGLLPELSLNSEQLGHYGMAVCQSLLFAVTPSVKWKPAPAPGTSQEHGSTPAEE